MKKNTASLFAYVQPVCMLLLVFLLCGILSPTASAADRSENETGIAAYVVIDGVRINRNAEILDWSGKEVNGLIRYAHALKNLKLIDLGRTALTAEELDAVRYAFPDAKLKYFVLFGKTWYSSGVKNLDLAFLDRDLIADTAELLTKLPLVKAVTLGEGIDPEIYVGLYQARPDIEYTFSLTLYGKELTAETERLKFRLTPMKEEDLLQLETVFSCLPKLNYVCFDRCGLSNEALAQLRDRLPQPEIVWRVYFGRFSCLTNAEKIWAIGELNDEMTDALQYCTKVRYLDLGHNAITNIDFVRNMPNLEVFIIAITDVADVSAVAECKKLEYFEIYESLVTDLTPLAGLTELRHLNLSGMPALQDITPLFGLDLERIDLRNNYGAVPQEQLDAFSALHPECRVNVENNTYESDWRYEHGVITPRYSLLREQIGYDDPYGTTLLYGWQDTDEFWEFETN